MAMLARTSFTVDPQLLDDLNFLSSRMGITKSAIVNHILGGAVSDLRRLVESVPPNPTHEDVLRLRGRSMEVIEDRLHQYQNLESGLFPPGVSQ